MESAEKCVKFLRDNNIGVATFIALDKVWSVVDWRVDQQKEKH